MGYRRPFNAYAAPDEDNEDYDDISEKHPCQDDAEDDQDEADWYEEEEADPSYEEGDFAEETECEREAAQLNLMEEIAARLGKLETERKADHQAYRRAGARRGSPALSPSPLHQGPGCLAGGQSAEMTA